MVMNPSTSHVTESFGPAPRPRAPPYGRRRLLAVVVLASVVFGGYGVAEAAGPSAPARSGAVNRTALADRHASLVGQAPLAQNVYVVKQGDTLWRIARTRWPDRDIRPVVSRLADQLGSATVRPGDRLVLPAA